MANEFEVETESGYLKLFEIGGEGAEIRMQCANIANPEIVERTLILHGFRARWESDRLVAVLGRD